MASKQRAMYRNQRLPSGPTHSERFQALSMKMRCLPVLTARKRAPAPLYPNDAGRSDTTLHSGYFWIRPNERLNGITITVIPR